MTDKDVHTEHCCENCGCKYGEDMPEISPVDDEPIIMCSVVSGRKPQSFPCGEASVCWDKSGENVVLMGY